jgi:DNA-binding response OmpR family regulator
MPSIGCTVIALLEADPAVRTAASLLLESRGIQVVAGATGSALAELIVASGVQPALIVADYRLGPKTAFEEVPKVVAASGANAVVIVASGRISPEARAQIEARGWRLLMKPYGPEELFSSIDGPPKEFA